MLANEPIKILLVDDRSENLLALSGVLDQSDYELICAQSGEQALKYLLQHDFALILMDVQMPGLNGFETAKLLRRRNKSRHIPIIFISAISQAEEHVQEGYLAGAIDYVFKPFHPDALRYKVERFVSLYKGRRQIEKQQAELEHLVRERTTELDKANEELRKSNEQLVHVLESITDALCVVDADWRITYVNSQTEQEIGLPRSEILGKMLWEISLHTPVVQAELQRVQINKQVVHFETYFAERNKWYQMHAYPFEGGLSVYFRDITVSRQYEQQMARLDRLNLVGEIAAGIAHEIRNPMTTVRGFLQLFKSKAGAANLEYINLMVEELDRANSIITEFLSLAKNKATEHEQKDLNEVTAAIVPLVQAEALMANKNIIFESQGTLSLYMDEKEIRQLILNLALNGLDAMQSGGTLTISTYADGQDIVLAVADQGCGIAPEDLGKIGTPFFTTKEKGTGLGLAVCYSIAARHKALIDIKTCTEGTTFFVRFRQ